MEEPSRTVPPSVKANNAVVKRLLVSVVGIPIVLLAVLKGGPAFFTLLAVSAIIGLSEYSKLTYGNEWSPTKIPMYLGGIAFLVSGYLGDQNMLMASIFLVVIFSGAIELANGKIEGAASRIAFACFGALYVGWSLAQLYSLRAMEPGGVMYVIFTFLVTWGTDSVAFFVGRAFGRHQLSAVSPSKSVEGAAGGLAGAVIIGCAMSRSLGLSAGEGAILALLASFFCQTGDLVESMLKRDAGVKDSGALIPGHGGVLDRIDSMLFSGPVIYCYLVLFH